MKTTLIILAIVLAALLILSAYIYFSDRSPETSYIPSTEPSAAPTQSSSADSTVPSESESTQPPEESTQPEPALRESGKVFIVNGVRMSTFVAENDETILVEASSYIQALGLDPEGSAHSSHKALLSLSADGLSLSVGEKTYSTVYDDCLYVPIYEFAEDFGYPAWVDDTYGGIYITPGAMPFVPPADVNVPVLMYHAVSDDCWGYSELFVSPSDMEEQLKYLVDNGYDPIWFEDLAHVEDYDKPVILTFDDGYDDNYTELFPLLQKYNVKATVFVIGQDTVGISHKLTEEQIREMSDSGLVSIQSHTYTHGYLDEMDEQTLEYELSESKKVIARITGKTPYVLCYPTGKYNDLSLKITQEHYNFGIKMVGGLYNTSDDAFLVNRYYIARSTDLYTFAQYVSDAGA